MRKDLHRELSPGLYPALRLALLLIAGICCADLLAFLPVCWPVIGCTAAVAWIISAWRAHNSAFQVGAYLFVIFAFGGTWYTFHDREPDFTGRGLSGIEPAPVFYGAVADIRTTAGGYTEADVNIDSVWVAGSGMWRTAFKTRARLFDQEAHPGLVTGHYIEFEGRLSEVPERRNPYDFDHQAYLKKLQIYTYVDINRILSSRAGQSLAGWSRWRIKATDRVGVIFSDEHSGIARALLLGDRKGIDRKWQTAFSRAGLAHLMAVSGMHVGFILLPYWLIIPWFWTFRFGTWLGLALAIMILIAYCGITGFSTSVIRASVMALLFIYGRLFQKPRQSLNLLGIAALVILLLNPGAVFDIGFQLSFTAVLVILLALPVTGSCWPEKLRHGRMRTFCQFVSISILVQAALYPVLMHYFNEFSLIGPASNILIIPLVQAMYLWTMASLCIEALHAGLGTWFNRPADVIAGFLLRYAEGASALPWSWIQGSVGSPFFFLVWGVLFLTFASMFKPALRWKMLAFLLLALCMHQGHLLYQKLSTPLTVTVFDIGQGDAVLLETPDGKKVLFDAGILSLYQNSAERVLLPELKARGIKELDAVILTHPHADHIGGISTLLRNIPIRIIYDSGFDYGSEVYLKYLADAKKMDVPIEIVRRGDLLAIGEAMRFFVLGPDPGLSVSNANTWSLVIKAVYGETAVLLPGDADHTAEHAMVSHYGPFLQSELLKVGHHGSRTSSGSAFLSAVQPAYSAASLSLQNRYSHPHAETIRRLQLSGTISLFTSLNGALVFTSDGRHLRPLVWRKD
ncbi:MAG: DNA internalization-related competence protein ComEC/Rec2 [Balneolales bacterium]